METTTSKPTFNAPEIKLHFLDYWRIIRIRKTVILAVFLLVEGILELALYFRVRQVRHAGWVLFDGIVTLILGILIWTHWPSSAVWVIGTLVGISLIFSGISRFMLSLAVRNISPASA